MNDHPFAVGHLETLRYFNDEVEAIRQVIDAQSDVLTKFEDVLARGHVRFEGGLDDSLAEDKPYALTRQCQARCIARQDTVRGLLLRSAELQRDIESQISGRKDQRETAIYIFTVVTVVFLPLSFVSSVFGMNTVEIRNTNLSQWSYWASAVPLTIVVILGSVWFAGQLDFVFAWLLNNGGRRSQQGYTPLPDSLADGRRARLVDDVTWKMLADADKSRIRSRSDGPLLPQPTGFQYRQRQRPQAYLDQDAGYPRMNVYDDYDPVYSGRRLDEDDYQPRSTSHRTRVSSRVKPDFR